jgi:hypothetical protein
MVWRKRPRLVENVRSSPPPAISRDGHIRVTNRLKT